MIHRVFSFVDEKAELYQSSKSYRIEDPLLLAEKETGQKAGSKFTLLVYDRTSAL